MYLDPVRFEAVQLTNEAAPITSFDVANAHTGLIYVVEQQLVEMDIISRTRTVLVDGTADLEDETDEEVPSWARNLDNPRYSPDGQQIVYVHEGLLLIDSHVGSNTATTELPAPSTLASNVLFDEEEPNPGAVRRYIGADWSSSGRYLLTKYSGWEGGSSDVIEVDSGESPFDEPFWIPCCDTRWGTSDETLVVASEAIVYGRPGLYHVDLPNEQVTPIFDGMPNQSNLTILTRGGHQSQSGEIFALLNQADLNNPTSLNAGLSYALHRISKTGTITPLNSSGIHRASELLWADDDSGLLMVNGDGALEWLPLNGDTVTSLFITGDNLRWGVPNPAIENAIAAYPSDSYPVQSFPVRGLTKQVVQDLALDLPSPLANTTIGTRYLAAPADFGQDSGNETPSADGSVWAAYSTKQQDFEQEAGHWVALYAQRAGAWEQLALLQFSIDLGEESPPGPDYVGPNPLKSTAFSTDRYWFSLEGGVGAHSSVYYLLSFDGQDLSIEASGFSSAGGGAGRIHNADNDSIADYLILDNTDYYVFCYACGVRRIQYDLLKWNGTEMVPLAFNRTR